MLKTYNISGQNVAITYRPNKTRNMISEIRVNRVHLYHLITNPIIRNGNIIFNQNVWTVTTTIFETIKQMKMAGNNKLAVHTADYLFNRFAGIYKKYRDKKLIIHSAHVITQLLEKIWSWETANFPAKIHKGTPFYFLADSFAKMGDWDSAFTFVFNSISQDKLAFINTSRPLNYKKSPAYMYATLVNNKHNFFYEPHIKDIRKWLIANLFEYRKFSGINLSYKDFESKFLRNDDLEEIVFLFVYQIQYILRNPLKITSLRDNAFNRLRNLNMLFTLCLIVDKVLEYRYRSLPMEKRKSLGKNMFNFFNEKNWLNGEKNSSAICQTLLEGGTDFHRNPNLIIPKILSGNIIYHWNLILEETGPLLMVWYLRNYGAHKMKGQRILISEFPNIIKFVIYALFSSLQ